ncbi:mannose-6-phosphate isomerase-like [Pollicipes pollicipes]|uniref:mannose-6-phosphate isomerase-like n=1 Tax=Pollicipes pollicipes TaxID=41117 RepID=UPI0018858D9F|nr:mannose-6-phosphate isomerase-like [Pollicipes pollicipes]XP_037089241.1 mannose-6-phosphate isomerase-like [Pollicipes pollicipes]
MELKCAHQTYHWGRRGSESTVAQLAAAAQGLAVDEASPYAELWMGTHPSGPSVLAKSGQQLADWIRQNPSALGEKVLQKFGQRLPYLFKVLSVNMALSIQAHPSKEHAEELHRARPDLYKDDNHKPEMALALTPFEALCGFRPLEQIQRFLTVVPELATVVGADAAGRLLAASPADPQARCHLRDCFRALMTREPAEVARHVEALAARLRAQGDSPSQDVPSELLLRLNGQFPGDVGCFCALFLNHLTLQPGEALFLGPNEPHAYLLGDCVELMACSDNVVRAGLTPKFKDVPTLVDMLTYKCAPPEQQLFAPTGTEGPGVVLFDPPVPDFTLAKIQFRPVVPDTGYTLPTRDSASLLLVVSGSGRCGDAAVRRGTVLFVPAGEAVTLRLDSQHEVLMFQAFCHL